jgi:hypothetical protein
LIIRGENIASFLFKAIISRKEARKISSQLSQKSKVESKKARNHHFTQRNKEAKPAI